MRMWVQSWQAATWPPSAAVRQRSMADMTLSWPRLTWPALARRQAAPWARKISATSSLSRDTRSRFYEAFFFSVLAGSNSSGLLTPCRSLLATWT